LNKAYFLLTSALFVALNADASIDSEIIEERIKRNGGQAIDTWTGLVWEDTIHAGGTRRPWGAGNSNERLSFVRAKVYCETLTLGNLNDFRVPADSELQYLSRIEKHMNYRSRFAYWSSTFLGSDRIARRRLSSGNLSKATLDSSAPVRCVSGKKDSLEALIKKERLSRKEKATQKSNKYYKIALSKNTVNSYTRFIKKYHDSHLVKEAKNNIVKLRQSLYAKAKQENTVEAYADFLESNPENKQREEAISSMYDLIKKNNSINSYSKFVKDYPNSKHRSEAFSSMYDLIKKNNSINSYSKFVKDYPNSKHRSEAIEKTFSLVKSEDNISGFEWFISKYPSDKHVKEAVQSIHRMSLNKAKQINTVSSYNTFIITYPSAKEVNEAQVQAFQLEVEKYTDFGMFGNFFEKEAKTEKSARKLLIKAKQIERKAKDYSGDASLGYILVTNRMYDLLQEKFDDSDATLRHLESQEFKDFVEEFKSAIKTVNYRLDNIAKHAQETINVAKQGFSDAKADRAMAAYKLEQHEKWEKFMHFRDKGYN